MNPKRSKYETVFRNLFSFPGYKLSDLKDTENQVLVILGKTGPPKCPRCGSVHGHIEESYTRIVRDLNLRHKQCHIEFEENKIGVTHNRLKKN